MGKSSKNRVHLLHFSIAGFSYYEGAVAFTKLKIGTKLKIVEEPDNKYDKNAVALYYKSHKLGFIPRQDNRFIAKMLSIGYHDCFEARVQFLNSTAPPENQVGVILYVIKEKPTLEDFGL